MSQNTKQIQPWVFGGPCSFLFLFDGTPPLYSRVYRYVMIDYYSAFEFSILTTPVHHRPETGTPRLMFRSC